MDDHSQHACGPSVFALSRESIQLLQLPGPPCPLPGPDYLYRDEVGGDWRNAGFPQTDSHPVVCVSAADAEAYSAWLSSVTGRKYRLPSEAEWEYAARAGTQTSTYWGNDLAAACRHANVADLTAVEKFDRIKENPPSHHLCHDGFIYTAPVGRFVANAFGLHDMIGNVSEWVGDCANSGYDGVPPVQAYAAGSIFGEKCEFLVVRGGHWADGWTVANAVNRRFLGPLNTFDRLGFRVARWD